MALAEAVEPTPGPSPRELAARVAARAAPVTLAGERSLPVVPALIPLLPDGLRRGSVVGVEGGPGATSLALVLTARASAEGSWVAVAGASGLGLAAAVELGLAPERLLVVPGPGSDGCTTIATVLAALVDAVDVVVVGACLSMPDARRLQARARERGAVLVALPGRWPLAVDVRLAVVDPIWEAPSCRLAARRVEVTAGGRAAASRPRRAALWLPSPDGTIQPAAELGERSVTDVPIAHPVREVGGASA